MPIPAAPSAPTVAEAVVALFRQLHDQVRVEIHGLADDDLNWSPFTGANSIAVTITHLVGSEAESVRTAAGMECQRDRDAEFERGHATMADIEALLSGADALLAEALPNVERRLWETAPLPTLPENELRPKITWLIGNYGHAREHLGHVQLTRDLRLRPAN